MFSQAHFSEQCGYGLINGAYDPTPRQSVGQPSTHQKGALLFHTRLNWEIWAPDP